MGYVHDVSAFKVFLDLWSKEVHVPTVPITSTLDSSAGYVEVEILVLLYVRAILLYIFLFIFHWCYLMADYIKYLISFDSYVSCLFLHFLLSN